MYVHFFFFFIISRLGVLVMDTCVKGWVTKYGGNVNLPKFSMSMADYACVVVNGLQETYFLMKLCHLTHFIPLFTFPFPGTVFCIFLLDDMLYGPFHKLLHHRSIYSYVHKRHHTISEPYAGYMHAAMEHPLEMTGGLAIHYLVLQTLSQLNILDAASLWIHLVLKSIVSIANHTGNGFQSAMYSNRTHFEHHKFRNSYFTQYNQLDEMLVGLRRIGWKTCLKFGEKVSIKK